MEKKNISDMNIISNKKPKKYMPYKQIGFFGGKNLNKNISSLKESLEKQVEFINICNSPIKKIMQNKPQRIIKEFIAKNQNEKEENDSEKNIPKFTENINKFEEIKKTTEENKITNSTKYNNEDIPKEELNLNIFKITNNNNNNNNNNTQSNISFNFNSMNLSRSKLQIKRSNTEKELNKMRILTQSNKTKNENDKEKDKDNSQDKNIKIKMSSTNFKDFPNFNKKNKGNNNNNNNKTNTTNNNIFNQTKNKSSKIILNTLNNNYKDTENSYKLKSPILIREQISANSENDADLYNNNNTGANILKNKFISVTINKGKDENNKENNNNNNENPKNNSMHSNNSSFKNTFTSNFNNFDSSKSKIAISPSVCIPFVNSPQDVAPKTSMFLESNNLLMVFLSCLTEMKIMANVGLNSLLIAFFKAF